MRDLRTILSDFSPARTILRPDHPVNLAVFRIVLCTALIVFYPPTFLDMSALPASLRIAPVGLEGILPFIPINETVARAMLTVFLVACTAGVIGFRSRTACAVAFLTGLYVYGVPQLFGKINHYHHLIWFIGILAVSRCGDALSVDCLLSRKKYAPSLLYSVPLRFIWALIGVIYFFPGYWKLMSAGWEWALSDNVRNMMYGKWFELGGFTPLFRIDQYPLLYHAAGVATILFELTFIIGIFIPRLRWIWIIGGLAFHWSIEHFMAIGFWQLRWCYVALVDWHSMFARLRPHRISVLGSVRDEQPYLTGVVGGFILLMNVLYGYALIDTWPFSVYPTFASMHGDRMQIVRVEATDKTNVKTLSSQEFVPLFGDTSRWWIMQVRIMYAGGPEELGNYCHDIADALRKTYPAYSSSTFSFFKEERSIIPERLKDPPFTSLLLCRIPPDPH
jgi:hypothetical protein